MHVKYVTFTFRGAWASDLLPEDFKVGKKKSIIELQTRQNTISGRTCIVELISLLFFFFYFFTRNQWETEKVGEPPVYFMTTKRIVISETLNRKTNIWITK